MRIISGRLKGRRIVGTPNDPGVRPISGRMRQSTFDILIPRLPGARFLDLFAGSGSVGLEALSRGAGRAVFVDQDARCLKGIQRNLEHFGLAGAADAVRAAVPGGLGRLRGQSFDLIFLGPPYKDAQKRPLKLTEPCLTAVVDLGLLAPGGMVVAQRHRSEKAGTPAGLALWRSQRYGDTEIDYFLRAEDPS